MIISHPPLRRGCFQHVMDFAKTTQAKQGHPFFVLLQGKNSEKFHITKKFREIV